MNLKFIIKNFKFKIIQFKKYGFKYTFNRKYREQFILNELRIKRNRKNNLDQRKKYGNNWSRKAHRLRQRLFSRDGNICFWCEQTMRYDNATIDHIIPVCQQPRNNSLSNLRLIHESCRRQRDKKVLILNGKVK